MATSTLRPSSTIGSDGSLTGAATVHAALSDNSDASYFTIDQLDEFLEVALTDFTLPADALVKGLVLRVRASNGGSGTGVYKAILTTSEGTAEATVNATWATPTTTTVLTLDQSISDAAIDGATLRIEKAGTGSTVATRLYEAYLDVIYVPKPVVTITGPSGTITDDDTPTVTWEVS